MLLRNRISSTSQGPVKPSLNRGKKAAVAKPVEESGEKPIKKKAKKDKIDSEDVPFEPVDVPVAGAAQVEDPGSVTNDVPEEPVIESASIDSVTYNALVYDDDTGIASQVAVKSSSIVSTPSSTAPISSPVRSR